MFIAIYLPIIIVVSGILIFLISKFLKNEIAQKVLKALGAVLFVIFIARVMMESTELSKVSGLTGVSFTAEGGFLTFLSAMLYWMTMAASLLVALSPFFKIRNVENLITYFVLPVMLLNLIFFRWNIITLDGTAAINEFNARILVYMFEMILILIIAVTNVIKTRRFKLSGKEIGILFTSLAGLLLAITPAWLPRVFFGPGSYVRYFDFTFEHRIIIYLSFIIPAAIFFSLRKYDYAVKKFACIFIAVATFLGTGFFFSNFQNVTSWPIHLCNTAMYVIPICLIFNLKKVFYFSLFINVFGAFAAIVLPDISGGGMFTGMEFWINHWSAFFMPWLIIALGIFERPKVKTFIYSNIAFAVYFVLILFINAWFSNYGTVDYFFVNGDFIVGKLGTWAVKLKGNFQFSFIIGELSFTFFWLYQLVFYFVYVLISSAMYFVYEQAYIVSDNLSKLFNEKRRYRLDMIALKSQLNGRAPSEPLNEKGVDMLRLIKFSKKYGSSKNYAVKEVDLEVKAGEIFGFLGPNGAGKSTIIKSIVGIQPITGGNIEVCGYDVEKQSVEAKHNIGFVPDHYALYEGLTGREYINYIADIHKVPTDKRTERIEHFVSIFALTDAFDNQIKTYSHGMKQKIAIMAALIHSPKLWILDEPLTGLDPTSIYQVKQTMKEYAKAGNIVFFSSHIIDIVENICDRIAIIKKGNIVENMSLKQLKAKKIKLEDLYLSHIEGKTEDKEVKAEPKTKTKNKKEKVKE